MVVGIGQGDRAWRPKSQDDKELSFAIYGVCAGNGFEKLKRLSGKIQKAFDIFGGPNGDRTRVSGVRGRYPRPLDDGTIKSLLAGFYIT